MRIVYIIIVFVLIVLIGFIDYFTGYHLSFSNFNLIPICLASIKLGRRYGIFFSAVSTVAWFCADCHSGHTYHYVFVLYWNISTRLVFYILIALIISSLQTAFEREHQMSRKDFLTGIANSKEFFEKATEEIERVNRYKRPLSVAYIDLDNFKSINDSLGHKAGDELLRVVAKSIACNIRKIDLVARLGGDEFGILLPETDEKAAIAICNKLCDLELTEMHHRNWPVTFSIGVVTFISPPATVDELIQKADNLMYSAKKAGKNTIIHGNYKL